MDFDQNQREHPMRGETPELYQRLQTELEAVHIHPYDIQANVLRKNGGLEIILRFGETFSNSRTQFFSMESIRKQQKTIIDFFRSTAEACKETLVADYYKMMKP